MAWPNINAQKYQSGKPLRTIAAEDIRFLLNVVKYLEGVGCFIEKTPSGIGWKILIPNAAPIDRTPAPASLIMPFDITSINATDITLIDGYVEVHADSGTTYIAPTSMTVAWATTGTRYVYVETDITAGTAALKEADATSMPASTATLYNKLLYKVEVTATGATPLVRYHRGNIEFVGWRP